MFLLRAQTPLGWPQESLQEFPYLSAKQDTINVGHLQGFTERSKQFHKIQRFGVCLLGNLWKMGFFPNALFQEIFSE